MRTARDAATARCLPLTAVDCRDHHNSDTPSPSLADLGEVIVIASRKTGSGVWRRGLTDCDWRHWTLVGSATLKRRWRKPAVLQLDTPVPIAPHERRCLYVHSLAQGGNGLLCHASIVGSTLRRDGCAQMPPCIPCPRTQACYPSHTAYVWWSQPARCIRIFLPICTCVALHLCNVLLRTVASSSILVAPSSHLT